METNLEKRMKKYARQHKRRKIWHKILSVLSAVVVFCTTYALILPAITQERETFCGTEEHTHSESCLAAEEKEIGRAHVLNSSHSGESRMPSSA